MKLTIVVAVLLFSSGIVALAQGAKTFNANGVSFEYPDGWTIYDDTNSDAQQVTIAHPNSDIQIRVFVHKGRISPDKFADAKKAFIDPYIAATMKQFVAMGAKPEQSADSSEIAGLKAEGVKISASLGEPGAAKIYWALVGQRVVILTIFGPDREIKQFATAWDLVRSSFKVEDKAAPKPSPKP
jgi:hypothetical protein